MNPENNHRKLKVCGNNCKACARAPYRSCNACKTKKRCKESKCSKYQQMVNARHKADKTCKKCYKEFSTLGSFRQHEAKSNCGTIAKKWSNLPHKCLLCLELDEKLFNNHESYILHTNQYHGGIIRTLDRCPITMTCPAYV